MYEETLMGRMSQSALPYAVHQTMMESGLSHQRCMSYDLLRCLDSPSPLDSGDERTPRLPDRPEGSGKASCASKSITRMHSMSAVPSGCLSPPGGVNRRKSILLPVQLQRNATSEQKPSEGAKPKKKSMSRSSSKDSDSSPSRKGSRISSIASPSSSLSSKLLAAFSSRMPLAAELLRLSKDRSTSLTSVASASQSMPSSPQSMMRRHAEGGLDARSPSKYEHAVGHSLSSSPPLTSERHALKKKLFSTLSTGNFLPMKLAECRRPKSASASPQHSSVVALKYSKHAKRTLSGSQESIHSTKTASAGKEHDVFYI